MRLTTDLSDADHAALVARRRAGSPLWRLIHAGGSLRLAMVLLLSIALLCAAATVTESRLSADVARHYLYHSPLFALWLGVLVFNLFCVTLTRWPWQRKHLGFVITHYGIITLLAGAVIGRTFGFEGMMNLEAGRPPERRVALNRTAVEVVTGERTGYKIALPTAVSPPTESRPRFFPIPDTSLRLRIDGYSPALVAEDRLLPSLDPASPAGIVLRFQSGMMGQSLTAALLEAPAERRTFDFFGLASIEWGDSSAAPPPGSAPLLRIERKPDGKVPYQLWREGKRYAQGFLKPGEPLPLGWADWQATLVSAESHAAVEETLSPKAEGETAPNSFPGLRVSLLSGNTPADAPLWIPSGETRWLHAPPGPGVRVGFGLETRPLPFGVRLLKFEVPRDEGTDTPADFISTVEFSDPSGRTAVDQAHMNYPASFPGGFWRSVLGLNYKFSQASWNPRNLREATLQVLFDPGWPFKWIGSILIVTGITLLFYFRPKKISPTSP